MPMGKVYDWIESNKKALGWAVGGTAAAVATHFGFDTRAFDGQSLYDMTDSVIRFVPYFATALSYGRAVEITMEGQRGRELTGGERLGAYTIGTLAASGLWECTENLSSFASFYNPAHEVFGDYVKSEFPGKGLASLGDTAMNLIAGVGTAVSKNILSNAVDSQKKFWGE